MATVIFLIAWVIMAIAFTVGVGVNWWQDMQTRKQASNAVDLSKVLGALAEAIDKQDAEIKAMKQALIATQSQLAETKQSLYELKQTQEGNNNHV